MHIIILSYHVTRYANHHHIILLYITIPITHYPCISCNKTKKLFYQNRIQLRVPLLEFMITHLQMRVTVKGSSVGANNNHHALTLHRLVALSRIALVDMI